MSAELLARMDAYDAAHDALCRTLDRLRLQAWKDQGRPTEAGWGDRQSAFFLTRTTPTMERVEAKIVELDRKLGEMEERYGEAMRDLAAKDCHSIGAA